MTCAAVPDTYQRGLVQYACMGYSRSKNRIRINAAGAGCNDTRIGMMDQTEGAFQKVG